MFRFMFALLLLNTSYHSLGAPTISNASVSVSHLLTSLAKRCENTFLISQINSQVTTCSDLKPIPGEKQLRCLMFYDINNQLCTAVGDAKLAITADYTETINEEQDVNTLCVGAKDWIFSNITEFDRYKQAVDKVFKHPVACGNICGVDDFMSDDVNFICKYYKWGSSMLKQQVTANSAPAAESAAAVTKPASAPSTADLNDFQIKNITKLDTKTELSTSQSGSVKTESTSQLNVSQVNSVLNTNKNKDVTNTGEEPVVQEKNEQNEKPSELDVKEDPDDAGEVKPETLEDTQNKHEESLKTGVDKEIQLLNNELEKKESELEKKESVLENPKDKIPDPDDYQESDEGKEGLGDTQGGDDGDDMLDDLNNKPIPQKEEVKRIETIATFVGERGDYYPNPIQEGMTPDEDNFFPFFLTAIILVVILYILYHNKNKVSKLFFGLILEGRQSTRRRNSRGHAYKRLDTLEQAMSTNSAAPPSKIIY